jgi:AraC-like DNA-binding protein
MSEAWYREVPPAPFLRPFVECYWFLRGSADFLSDPQPILPDGRMEIVFNLGAPFRRSHPNGRTETQPARMLIGQMDHHVTVLPEGPVDVVGVRFHPSGAHPLLLFPMSELRNELVPLGDVVAMRECLDGIPLARRARALDAALTTHFASARPPDADFERGIASVVAAEGRVAVDDLARDMGLGPRQLERKFRERVGLPPKRFAKILRFQSVFRRAFRPDERPWAQLALDCGYFDQAHFIRDFKSFTGQSPGALFDRENALTRVFTRKARSDSYNTNL